MKNFNALSLLLLGIMVASCNKELSEDQKALNVYRNSAVIYLGTMSIAMESSGMKMGESAEEILNGVDSASQMMVQKFAELKVDNEGLYDKMFSSTIIPKGVALAEGIELPENLIPISQNLSKEQIRAYIDYVINNQQKSDDPLGKGLRKLMEWNQQLDSVWKSDPQIKQYLSTLKQ